MMSAKSPIKGPGGGTKRPPVGSWGSRTGSLTPTSTWAPIASCTSNPWHDW